MTISYDVLERALQSIKQAWPEAKPSCGLILGSGWSDVAEAFTVKSTIAYEDIPGLGAPGVVGHSGRLIWAEHAGMETFVFQGRRHWYEGEGWTPVSLPIYVLKKLGCTRLMVTNAAGGINSDFQVGDLMVITDHINAMCAHPLIGKANSIWGPRFPDQTYLYNAKLRDQLALAARKCNIRLKQGVYLAASGPTYETPAEIRSYKTWGADAVGMSTVPEAMLANAAGIKVVGLSCITNFAAGILDQPLSHKEVTEATRVAMPKMTSLVLQFWGEMAETGLD